MSTIENIFLLEMDLEWSNIEKTLIIAWNKLDYVLKRIALDIVHNFF